MHHRVHRCRFATEFGLAPVVVSDSQGDWFEAGEYTFQKLLEVIGPRDVFAKRAGEAPCTQVCPDSACVFLLWRVSDHIPSL